MPLYHISRIRPSPSVTSLLSQQVAGGASCRGRVLPSGKISVGRVPSPRVLSADALYERTRTHFVCYKKEHWHYEKGLVQEYFFAPERVPELGLASVSICHKGEKRKYGLKGISRKGRVAVREGAFLLERQYGRRLGFYTLTCPYTDPQSIYSYNQNIAYIQRTYFQELKREYERQGVVWSYVSVLEIQTKRFERDGEPVLHIHYLSPCYLPGTSNWICDASFLRGLWARVLGNCLQGTPNTSASLDASVVHSSAVGYLSKYMSKGSSEVGFLAQVCPDQLPGRWWGMSRNVRKAIASNTIHLPSSISEYILYNEELDPSSPFYMRYRRDVYVNIRGEDKLVGVSGNTLPNQISRSMGRGDFLCLYEEI